MADEFKEKKDGKSIDDLKPLAEGKLTAKVYDENGNLVEETEKLRVKGKGSISTHRITDRKDRKEGESHTPIKEAKKKWKQR